MTVETVTYVEDLNITLPTAGDPKSEGDDHIRNIKKALKAGHFPFPVVQAASSDPNTLDDYEEGTFTPTFEGSTTAGTFTYYNQVGRYTKIGNRCFYQLRIEITALAVASGDIRIAGFPYSGVNIADALNAAAVTLFKFQLTSGYTQMSAYMDTVQTRLYLCKSGDALDSTNMTMSANMMNNSYITASGHYETAS